MQLHFGIVEIKLPSTDEEKFPIILGSAGVQFIAGETRARGRRGIEREAEGGAGFMAFSVPEPHLDCG